MAKTDGKYVEICDRKEAITYAIEHVGEENGWVQAEYNGQKGYVSSDYVTDQEPDITTQETE